MLAYQIPLTVYPFYKVGKTCQDHNIIANHIILQIQKVDEAWLFIVLSYRWLDVLFIPLLFTDM